MKFPVLFLIFTIFSFSFVSSLKAQQSVNINEQFESSWMSPGWSSTTFTQNSTQNHTISGLKSAAYTYLGVSSTGMITSSKFAVTDGQVLDTISFWIKRTSIFSLGGTLTVKLSGSVTNAVLGTVSLSSLANNTWQNNLFSYTAAVSDSIFIILDVSVPAAIGSFYIDDIAVKSPAPLPVSMEYFRYSLAENNVVLDWKTLIEINNSGFDIERKTGSGNSWQKIGFVTGNGTINSPVVYSYRDKGLTSGSYSYRLKQVDYNGNFEYFTLSSEVLIRSPHDYKLEQNYPNPSNPTTNINFSIPKDSYISFKIFDIAGKEVKTLVNENLEAGYHTLLFNGTDLSSGLYFYKLETPEFSSTKKFILIK